jgi:hypothetical protein
MSLQIEILGGPDLGRAVHGVEIAGDRFIGFDLLRLACARCLKRRNVGFALNSRH